MKKKLLLLSFALFTTAFLLLHAQSPALQWQKTYGGSNDEFANSMQPTADGGYVMAGYTESSDGDLTSNYGGKDVWVAKTDAQGTLIWQGNFGGSFDDVANCIKQTQDGGFIVAGSTRSNNFDVNGNHGSSDCWVIKLNASGYLQWQKTLGGTNPDEATAIIQAQNGDYYLVGSVLSNDGDISGLHNPGQGEQDIWLAQLDSVGNLVGQLCYGGTASESPTDIQETPNGFVICGSARSDDGDVTGHTVGNSDFWVLEIADDGHILWNKCYGGGQADVARSIKPTSDGYIVCGETRSFFLDGYHFDGVNNADDYMVIKISTNGTLQWQKLFGGTNDDHALSVIQTNDGGYLVAGESRSVNGDLDILNTYGVYDYWLVKLDANGNVEWDKSLGGGWNDTPTALEQTADDGFIVCGYSNSTDGVVTGLHGSSHAWDYWLVKLGHENTSGIANNSSENISVSILPNPAHTSISIHTTSFENGFDAVIMDVTGKKVMQLSGQTTQRPINVESLAKGFYLLQITDGNRISKGKLIKQ